MNNNFRKAAVTGENDAGKRADRIIRSILPDMSLSSVYKEMRSGRIRINGKKIKPDLRVQNGDIISVHISLLEKINNDITNLSETVLKDNYNSSNTVNIIDSGKKDRLQYLNSSLSRSAVNRLKKAFEESIIFENCNILALDKKRGMPVHGGSFKRETETLDECVKLYLEGKIPGSITFSPGPLHRLDRNTSGIILFGKSIEGARVFSEMLRSGKTEKYYIALFDGQIKDEVIWENIISQDKFLKKSVSQVSDHTGKKQINEGKKALTVIKPVVYNNGNTLAVVKIPTGRYHQIRKQGQLNSHSLTADMKYGGKKTVPFYLLHSFKLVLKEDSEITGFKSLKAPVPDYFIKYSSGLFSRNDIEEFINFTSGF